MRGVLNLRVDEFFVAGVDEWNQEDDTGGEESKAPSGEKLDEEVAEEGDEEGLLLSVKMTRMRKSLTVPVMTTFSASTIRWTSITKKLISCSTSSKIVSSVSLGMV